MTRPLKLVTLEPETVDLYARWKAEIAAIAWDRVHIAGDRRQPVMLDDTRRRVWR